MAKKFVVKLGGASLSHPETLSQAAALIRDLKSQGAEVLVVHGGGPAINLELERQGITWTFINGQRQTTPEMMSVIDEVLGTTVNSAICREFREHDLACVGMNCADHGVLSCVHFDPELQQVGKIVSVDLSPVLEAMESESRPVPVLAPIGVNDGGLRFNINADWAAAQIAIAFEAHALIFLTDQSGIWDENKAPLIRATPNLLETLIQKDVIQGGMLTKVRTMLVALNKGVSLVQVGLASQASEFLKNPNWGTKLIPEDTNSTLGEEIVWTQN